MKEVAGFRLPEELYYERRDHLWVRPEAGGYRVGLDDLGQKSAGEVRHLQLKSLGTEVLRKRPFGTIEAGKYVGALRSPLDGTILEINQRVLDDPSLVNRDPFGEGWFVLLAVDDPEGLQELLTGEAAAEWLQGEIGQYQGSGLLKE